MNAPYAVRREPIRKSSRMDGCSQSRIIPAVLQQAEGRTRPRTQDQAALVPTPTADTLPRRYADFDTLGEARSEEHTSELQSLMRSSYAVFCLKKKTKIQNRN